MKQVFNKLTDRFEWMDESTVAPLETKGKVIVLPDDKSVKVQVVKDFNFKQRTYKRGSECEMLVVDAHNWHAHGYVNIVKESKTKAEKTNLEDKTEKTNLDNKAGKGGKDKTGEKK